MDGWRVGSATITPIIELDGVTSPRFLFDDFDRAKVLGLVERASWLAPHFVDDAGSLLQRVQCLVLEIGDRRIAIDTCVGNDKIRTYAGWNDLQLPFLDHLANARFALESIDTVICTHLRVDHVGWNTQLLDGRWVPTFPRARYVFVRTEYKHLLQNPYHDGDFLGDSIAPIVEAGLADFVDVDHIVADGVRLVHTPGHTPGHVSVLLESDSKRAVITGDMMHTPIQIADVGLSARVDFDPTLAAATRRSFLAQFVDDTLVIGTHWGGPGAGRVRTDGVSWSLEV